MRIAMVLSGIGVRDKDRETAARLAEGLAAKGLEIVRFFPPSPDLGPESETARLAAAFKAAEACDLVLGLGGAELGALAALTSTPAAVTVLQTPDAAAAEAIKKSSQVVHYLAASPEALAGLVQAEAVADPSAPGAAEEYLAVFNRVADFHRREDHRPWGFYRVLADEPDHKVKRIVVYPGKRLSLQRHRRRSEHWHVIWGEAVVTLDGRDVHLKAGQSVDIGKGASHRIMNPTAADMAFIEVQRGDYFGEDDIERLEDDFGRK